MSSKNATTPKWTALHFNALALEIRELFPIDGPNDHWEFRQDAQRKNVEQRAILTTLALSLATRFKADNPLFDPKKFLDACSPDPTVYPLSELWEEYES